MKIKFKLDITRFRAYILRHKLVLCWCYITSAASLDLSRHIRRDLSAEWYHQSAEWHLTSIRNRANNSRVNRGDYVIDNQTTHLSTRRLLSDDLMLMRLERLGCDKSWKPFFLLAILARVCERSFDRPQTFPKMRCWPDVNPRLIIVSQLNCSFLLIHRFIRVAVKRHFCAFLTENRDWWGVISCQWCLLNGDQGFLVQGFENNFLNFQVRKGHAPTGYCPPKPRHCRNFSQIWRIARQWTKNYFHLWA